MIVRILDEGQYELDDAHADHAGLIGEQDKALLAAIEAGDEEAFKSALESVVSLVHEHGTKIEDPTTALPSDLVVPALDSTLEEVRSLLASEEVGEE